MCGVNSPVADMIQNTQDYQNWFNSVQSVSKKDNFNEYFQTPFSFEKEGNIYPVVIDFTFDDEMIFAFASNIKVNGNFDPSSQNHFKPYTKKEGEFFGIRNWCIS